VWAACAILTGHLAAGVPALVNGPAAVLILTRLEAARRACAAVLRMGATLASSGQPTEPAVLGGTARR
jgi:hypothetical protein